MNLENWLQVRDNTGAQLARLTGFAPPVISKLLHGKLPCSLTIACKLDRATKGEISAEEMVSKDEDIALIAYMRGSNAVHQGVVPRAGSK